MADAAVPTDANAPPGGEADVDATPDLFAAVSISLQKAASQPKSIVFIDSAVSDLDLIVDAVPPSAEVVFLDAARDGVLQIADALKERAGFDAIHIVSHGAAGTVSLGNALLTSRSIIGEHSNALTTIGAALAETGDILIYGCDVGFGEHGQEFLRAFSSATGADIAASSDVTGHAEFGGDWLLETSVGEVAATTAFNATELEQWRHQLGLTATGGETRVNATTTSSQTTTLNGNGGGTVALDGAGNYVVVWNDARTNSGDVYFQRYDAAGIAQGGNVLVNSTTANLQSAANVAMDANGNFVVVWSSHSGQDGSGIGIYAQRYNASGVAQGGEFRVNQTTFDDQLMPTIAMSSTGAFVVTWIDNAADGSSGGVYARSYDANGVAQGGEFRVNSSTSGIQAFQFAAMDTAGNFVVVWESGHAGSIDIYGQRYNASGSAQGSEFRVNSTTGNSQWNSSVGMDQSGNFVVVWESINQDPGGSTGIYAQRYNASGVAQGGEFRINATTNNTQAFPAVAMNAAGNFVVAWQSEFQDGSGWGIYTQAYDATGIALGSEIRVNSTTANAQERPSVSYSGSSAVVVWQGNGTGDTSGVFYQRFAAAQPPVIDLDANNSSGATGSNFNRVFNEGLGAVTIADADAAIADTDSSNLTGMTVTLTSRPNGASEILAANTGGTSITASYNSSTGVLTLSGTASVAQYQQVLRTITYNNTAVDPTGGTRTITFTTTDGTYSSAVATTTLSMNLAPDNLVVTSTNSGGLELNTIGNNTYLVSDDVQYFGGLTSFTIETQFSISNTASSESPLFSYAVDGTSDNEVYLRILPSGRIALSINGVTQTTTNAYSQLIDGSTHTVSVSWASSGGAASFYIDGALAESFSGLKNGHSIAGGGTVVLGQDQDSELGGFSPTQIFSGVLYDMRFFSDVRTAAEISAFAGRTIERSEPGLAIHWEFDKLSPSGVIPDRIAGLNLSVFQTSGAGFTADVAELTLAISENTVNGTSVGSFAGIDADRQAQIAALLSSDPNLYYSDLTNKFYRFVNTTGSWSAAESAARNGAGTSLLSGVTGQLVTIRSAHENEIVTQIASSRGSDVWIAASDAATEGTWRWIEGGIARDRFWSGSGVGHTFGDAYENWAVNQPDDAGGEDGVELQTGGQWNDSNATDNRYVVEWSADDVLDAQNALIYTLISQSVAGAFTINADTGLITVADTTKIDHETLASHTLTLRVTDQNGLWREETFNVAINNAPDAPVNTLPTSYSGLQNSTTTLTGISISDADGGMQTVTLAVTNGTLSLTGTTGLSFVSGDGVNDANMVFSGSIANINAALTNMTFNPSVGFTGAANLTMTVVETPVASSSLINGGFEVPDYPDTNSWRYVNHMDVAGWQTSTADGIIEINDGTNAYQGNQYVEVNANQASNISQTIGSKAGAQLLLDFAHRGRSGTDVMNVRVTDLGVDGVLGTVDDVVVLNENISTGNTAWQAYTRAITSAASGNDYHIAFSSVSTAGNISNQGNFLDGIAVREAQADTNTSTITISAPPSDLFSRPGISATSILGDYNFTSTAGSSRDDDPTSNPITWTGAPTVTTGQSGQLGAIDLTGGGSGPYGDIVGLTTGGPMTIAGTVRFDSTTDWARIVDFGQAFSGGAGNIYVGREWTTNNLIFTIETNNGSVATYRATAANAIVNGQWLHFAATVDASGNMSLYVNGTLAASATGIVLSTTVRDNNFIGRSHWENNGDARFDGAIDNLLILNTALGAADVTRLYQQTGFTVPENSANGVVVGSVTAIDADATASYTYTLTDSAGGRFAISANGTITVANGSLLDFETATSHTITVRVTDQNGGTYTETFTVAVTNVADAPPGSPRPVRRNRRCRGADPAHTCRDAIHRP